MFKFLIIIFILILVGPFSHAWANEANNQKTTTLEYHVDGVTGSLKENIQNELKAANTEKIDFANKKEIIVLYHKNKEIILNNLQAFGYFKPIIDSELKYENTHWAAYFHIQLGEAIKISSLDILLTGPGEFDPQIKKFLRKFPLKQNEIFTIEKYNLAKQTFFNVALQQGYLKAQITKHEIQIDLKKYTAKIILHFETGHRYYFGPVSFSPSPYRESFLRRFINFKEGKPYSSDDIVSFQGNLNGGSYFQQVLVTPQIEEAQDFKVPIHVQLTARKPYQYTAGLGYGTDTGPRATLGWEWRRVTDKGQRLATLLRVSPVQSSLQGIYTIPGKNPAKDQYNLYTNIISENLKQGDSRTAQLGAAYVHDLYSWQQTISLYYQISRSQIVGQSSNLTNFLIPSIAWLKTQSNNTLYPTKGQRFNITIQGASKNILSDANLFETEFKAKFIRSPTKNSRIILRGDLGYSAANDFTKLPIPLRFFAGGTQSIRGYDYQVLGPGRYLTVASAEFQHQIYGKWHGAIFYDIGNASDQFAKPLKRGTGIGLLWVSPIGPFELTLAKAIDLPGKPMRLQFSMGPDL